MTAMTAVLKKKSGVGKEGLGAKETIRMLFSFRKEEHSHQMKFHRHSADLFAKSALRNPREGLGDDITVP